MSRKSWATPAGSGVVTMERTKNNCTGMDTKLADLLLDPGAVPAKVRTHVDGCDRCRAELAELQATMALLNRYLGPVYTLVLRAVGDRVHQLTARRSPNPFMQREQ